MDDDFLDKKKYPFALDLIIHSLKYESSMYICRTHLWHDIIWWHQDGWRYTGGYD